MAVVGRGRDFQDPGGIAETSRITMTKALHSPGVRALSLSCRTGRVPRLKSPANPCAKHGVLPEVSFAWQPLRLRSRFAYDLGAYAPSTSAQWMDPGQARPLRRATEEYPLLPRHTGHPPPTSRGTFDTRKFSLSRSSGIERPAPFVGNDTLIGMSHGTGHGC